jgi:hypothetical protein
MMHRIEQIIKHLDSEIRMNLGNIQLSKELAAEIQQILIGLTKK